MHHIHVCSEYHSFPIGQLSLLNIELELKQINDPYQLGIHLGLPTEVLEQIEKDYPSNIIRQRTEVIKYWLRNSATPTWEKLAASVERIGGYGILVKRLRDLGTSPVLTVHSKCPLYCRYNVGTLLSRDR